MSGIDPARVGVLNLMAALRESPDQAKADRQVVTAEAAGAVPDDVIEEVVKVIPPGQVPARVRIGRPSRAIRDEMRRAFPRDTRRVKVEPEGES